MRFPGLAALVLASLLLASCAGGGGHFGGATDLNMVAGDPLPTPNLDDYKAKERPYRVGPFDKLEVSVFRVEELSNLQIQVDVSGRISFPLIGTVEVAGLTPKEIEQSMTARLRGRFINDPQVTVNLLDIGSQTVTIGGEVEKPGLYPVIGRMTLMRAVATAEGPTEFARRSDVVIFRTVGNQEFSAIYNLRAIERGNYPDPEVFANDVVMVGENQVKRIFKDYISPFIAPVILVTERIATQ